METHLLIWAPSPGTLAGSPGSLARHWEAVTSSEHAGEPVHLLEVFHPDADKWTMIQSHCDDVGLDARRAAAVGDGLNDVLMIEQCGIGIAMANADHRVLAVANSVTGLTDELWKEILFEGENYDREDAKRICMNFLASIFTWNFNMPVEAVENTDDALGIISIIKANKENLDAAADLFGLYRQF